jgi:hypothetical protein
MGSNIIEQSAKVLGLPIILASCNSKNYEIIFEVVKTMRKNNLIHIISHVKLYT